MTQDQGRVLYIVACAAPPARDVGKVIRPAQQAGWRVCLIATPQATKFIDLDAAAALTGHPVRNEYKQGEEFLVVISNPHDIADKPYTGEDIAKDQSSCES